ncbi:PucR family transcriptional regulator [Nesterenkonia muleiensis]|uniref:PucR family transcriptional regulator n=1 Tax=Nesterenkonia muleiensis TaxID=2282648 RepID=UPI000E716BC1|nr:PucR family transcriptional regulator ligand-binding domain-containing protein [Nesterenkonia muleiensis]
MSDPLTLHEALQLEPISTGSPELLTPSARMDRSIRWVHIIGQELPGNMLQGGELVLSTLPRLREDRDDLVPALHGYMADLDGIGAAALAIEVLQDRPRLRSALQQVAAERETVEDPELTPLLLFRRIVRFVEITEALHRQLVSRQLGLAEAPSSAWDPIVSATTNLFDDLASPGGLPQEEIFDRAKALGMPAGARYTPMVFRIHGVHGPRDTADGQAPFLAALIRSSASSLRFPALVGSGGAGEIWVLLAHGVPQKLCTGLRQEVVRRRNQEIIPRYTVALGTGPIALPESPETLGTTARIAASAAELMQRSPMGSIPSQVSQCGFWTAADLGLTGLLVHLADSPHAAWFLDHHLAPFRGAEGEQMRQLVLASLAIGNNKAELARTLGVSRPTLYARISRLERTLGRRLDGETLTTLHIALLLEGLTGQA